jgi:hypothetical protein
VGSDLNVEFKKFEVHLPALKFWPIRESMARKQAFIKGAPILGEMGPLAPAPPKA